MTKFNIIPTRTLHKAFDLAKREVERCDDKKIISSELEKIKHIKETAHNLYNMIRSYSNYIKIMTFDAFSNQKDYPKKISKEHLLIPKIFFEMMMYHKPKKYLYEKNSFDTFSFICNCLTQQIKSYKPEQQILKKRNIIKQDNFNLLKCNTKEIFSYFKIKLYDEENMREISNSNNPAFLPEDVWNDQSDFESKLLIKNNIDKKD